MEKKKDERRSFLKHILIGTGAAVTTAAIARPAKSKPAHHMDDSDETLYSSSDNFEKYYKTLR